MRLSRMVIPIDLAESLVDASDCRLDHHGGCQEHGYLDLDGDMCPQADLKFRIARRKLAIHDSTEANP